MHRVKTTKRTIIIILTLSFILLSVKPALDNNPKLGKAAIRSSSASNTKVLVLYSSEADLNLAIFLAHEVNAALVGYNISMPSIRTILPFSLIRSYPFFLYMKILMI